MNDTMLMEIALGLVLVGALYVIRGWIDAIPARLRFAVMQERERDERKALDALQEATARKVGALTRSLRDHEEQIAATFRAQVSAAQARARAAELRAGVTEREALEAISVLSAARELVAELRALRDATAPAVPQAAHESDEQSCDDANEETKVLASPGPLRVPVRRPPPVPRPPLALALEEGEPAPGTKQEES